MTAHSFTVTGNGSYPLGAGFNAVISITATAATCSVQSAATLASVYTFTAPESREVFLSRNASTKAVSTLEVTGYVSDFDVTMERAYPNC